ncbi:AlpA family transcriptional regulator [Acidocella sp.]|uniref:helix-turn-helix transcriptional regulator n=1 Tax=Acidocella sp. TaxID=50710 RepID=UPI0026150FFD|nr:AlpA family phage regulatory protein [Acidocella sp.]
MSEPSPRLVFISVKEVSERVHLDPSTIYRWVRHGKFPEPRRLSGRCTVWVESEITAWQIAQTAQPPVPRRGRPTGAMVKAAQEGANA